MKRILISHKFLVAEPYYSTELFLYSQDEYLGNFLLHHLLVCTKLTAMLEGATTDRKYPIFCFVGAVPLYKPNNVRVLRKKNSDWLTELIIDFAASFTRRKHEVKHVFKLFSATHYLIELGILMFVPSLMCGMGIVRIEKVLSQ